jgi:hypothetical protein
MSLPFIKDRHDFKIYTTNLVNILKDKPIGSVFKFSELSAFAGNDVMKFRSIVASAKGQLLKYHNILLISVRGIGYQLCTSDTKVTEVAHLRNKSYRQTKKSLQILNSVDQSTLSAPMRHEFNLESIKTANLLGLHHAFSPKVIGDKTIKKIDHSEFLKAIL